MRNSNIIIENTRKTMTYPARIQHAIEFTTKAHSGQTRKGKPDVPYIIHPLAVALILSRAGADEDVIIAGILHDAVEDSSGKITLDDIEQQFSEAVAALVGHVTEQDKSLPWEERKQQALAHIYEMPYDALLLKSADVLANLSDLTADIAKEGDSVWQHFNALKEKQLERYRNLIEALQTVWPENPLLLEIKEKVIELQ